MVQQSNPCANAQVGTFVQLDVTKSIFALKGCKGMTILETSQAFSPSLRLDSRSLSTCLLVSKCKRNLVKTSALELYEDPTNIADGFQLNALSSFHRLLAVTAFSQIGCCVCTRRRMHKMQSMRFHCFLSCHLLP